MTARAASPRIALAGVDPRSRVSQRVHELRRAYQDAVLREHGQLGLTATMAEWCEKAAIARAALEVAQDQRRGIRVSPYDRNRLTAKLRKAERVLGLQLTGAPA